VVVALPWDGDFPLTQLFGENPTAYARFGLAGHNGVDVGLPIGTLVRAVWDGDVLWNGADPGGYGLYVVLTTPWGGSLLYAHLSDRGNHPLGEQVKAGDPLAYSGSTGNSTGPHLHLGLRPDRAYTRGPFAGYTDPLPFLLW